MQIADCLSRNSQRESEWREDDEEMPAGIIKSEDLFVTKSSAEMLVVQLEKGLYELSLSTLLEEGLGGEVLAAYGAGGQEDDDGSDDGWGSQPGVTIFPTACGLSQSLKSKCCKHSRSVTFAVT